MHGKREFDRASYETDHQFERAVDTASKTMGADEKRAFLFSLFRECRGCGAQPRFETLEVRTIRPLNRSELVCKACLRSVDVPVGGGMSLGRVVTLWNTTPLTIEVAHAC